jgi:hypothetical protein
MRLAQFNSGDAGPTASSARQIEDCFGTSLRHVALVVGSHVDRRLARTGALAMALNGSTVLLSSYLVERAHPELRSLVIAHELAHVVQLSRRGSDPQELLEAEAWEAAWHAVRRMPFRVRGAASRPLAAKAIIAMGGALNTAALAHYQQFQAERLLAAGAIAVSSPKIVANISWEAVLDEIIAGTPGNTDKSFVVCAHGSKDGMTMPLVAGSGFAATTTSLELLMQPTAPTFKPVGGVAPPTNSQVAALVTKMQSVRTLNIGYVEFRGCSLGMDIKNLEVLREFLGCISTSALDVKSSWAMVRPRILPTGQFTTWIKATPGVQVWTFAGGRCGLRIDWATHTVFFAAESAAVVPLWMKDHFFRMPPFTGSPVYEGWMANFGLHGLHLTPVVLPMDVDYAKHLKRVVSTPTGLVRM